MNRGQDFICEDCTIAFRVYHKFHNTQRVYCPVCGDCVSIERYAAPKDSSRAKLKWTDYEKELLQRCLNNELKPYQVAILTGRSSKAVSQQLYIKRGGKR